MPNRLADQTSPYLLQHADNPVDWYPWGSEAFNAARARDVPIFLSVGYSTCYWCHVMERESFEDESVAARLNKSFVAIKVDREERPDVDEIYMLATQLMTGHGGWPMSVFLEPGQLRPFWCGTYFPPEPRGNMPGFADVLDAIAGVWRDRREEALAQAEQLAQAVRSQLALQHEPVPIGDPQIEQAIEQLMRMFDQTHGGFGGAPKFPQPVFIDFLLDARARVDDRPAQAAIDHAIRVTLDQIAIGGIHDQVGGGFHRYSVDATWTVPHFEKMLYDNAQLALVFARAADIFDDAYYRRVVRTTLDYVLREMTDAHAPGHEGFWSAQDAEVDHREGFNYLWTREQFEHVLGDDAAWAARVYGLDAGPNFKDPHHPAEPARSVLRLADRPDRLAEREGIGLEQFFDRLDRVNASLLSARMQRKQPLTDDKVLASWNGLMIQALVAGGVLLHEARYIEAARSAARFIIEQMHDAQGNLLRSYRARTAHTPAFLEDHAAMVRALVALARVSSGGDGFDSKVAAVELAERAHAAFADETGAYYDTRAEQGDLFVRAQATYDGALPSGVSMMVHALIDLHELTGQGVHADRAGALVRAISSAVARSPVGAVHSTAALLRMLSCPDERLRGQVDRAAAVATGPTAPARKPVQVFADTDEIRVTPEAPGVVHVELAIREGYHIVAANPGPSGKGLVPLRVGLVRGQGVAVYADYPPGEPYGPDEKLLVHKGSVRLTVAVEYAPGVGAGAGEPVLGVTFQACTDSECLEPQTIPLEIRVKVEK